MSNTQNFLTDNIEDIMSVADDTPSIQSVGSSTSVLDKIDIITNYESSRLGSDINNRFSAIDSNFKRIVQSDYLRGAPGANYGSKHIYFAKLDPNRVGANSNYNNKAIYNPVVKSGGSDPIRMDNAYIIRSLRDAILSKCLGNTNNLSQDPYINNGQEVNDDFWYNSQNESSLVALKPIQTANGDTINWHDNIASGKNDDYNVFTFIVEDQNGTLNAYSSLVYVFIDKRFEYITDANKDQYEGLVDLSCAIYFSYKTTGYSSGTWGDPTYSGVFESVQTFPTIEYNTDGNFYWKIYGSNSGLLAQGPKGDAASSAMIYCTYTPIAEADDYVKLEQVLVTYIENGEQVTKFMDVKEAVNKNYINLETVKNDGNHTKICAFCVHKSDATEPVIMGTICYTEDQDIIKSNDSNYIVRFESQLSFNHLFNQHNFFNIMLENYNDGSTTSTENKFGALFLPISKNSEIEGASVAAHTIYPTNDSDTEGVQKTLNILPVKNIKNGIPKNLVNMDGVILADCPMNVYYDVNLIKKSLSFDTSELTAVNSENSEIKIPHDFTKNKANFEVEYNPYVIENSGNYIATPSLNVKFNWDYPNGINSLPTTVKPNMGLEGLALTLKFNPSDVIKHSVLDLISDFAKNEYVDNWAGAVVGNEYLLRNILLKEDNDNKLFFRLIKTIGSIYYTGDAAGNMYNYNLNTEYCNFTPILFYSSVLSANTLRPRMFNIGKTNLKDADNNDIIINIDNAPYKNIYFCGNAYPQKRRISPTDSTNKTYSASTYTDAKGISYRNYIDMYTHTYSNGANQGTIDIAQSNFAADDTSRLLKCPSYSLYRDYRSGKSLIANTGTTGSKISYKKDHTKAYDSHPLDYNEGDNSNIASHEGGVVYPHKIMLTNNANDADNISNNSNLRNGVHQLNRTISGSTDATEKYENYGTCIAYIHAPTTIYEKPLNYQYFEGNNAVKIDLKFDKLIAPIINIRSNAYTSPGNDFMRACRWHNSGLYLAAFNTLNTGLAINKATHSLSYRLVYKVKEGEGSQETEVIKRTDNIQLTSTKAIQNIQTGVCGNMRRVFFDDAHNTSFAEKTNKVIRDNAPMMGQLCDPKLMVRAAYPIALEDYAKQQALYPNYNRYSTTYDSRSSNISNPAIYGLNVHRNPYMYGVQWLYNGGNVSTDKTQLPYGTNYLLELHNRNETAYKLYSMSKHCTPNDSLYNIGLYHMTYDNNGSKQLYTGNDGYRTVTLPYYPGNCSLIIDSNVFNKIPSTDRAHATTPNAELVGVEIIYNCEVVFDTLLDVISGSVFSDSYNWHYAADVWSDNYGSGLDVFISDAISHSKFIKHDLNSQINRLYASTSKSGTVWDARPNPQIAIDNGYTLKNEECYSGYRGTSYYISGDNAVHHPGSGYIYASTYDLDSYYNRAFINPYYYTSNSGNIANISKVISGTNTNIPVGSETNIPGDLIFNFRADKEKYAGNNVAYSDSPKGLDYKNLRLCYQYTGLSLKPIDGKRNISFKASNTNKLFNHPPYFMGVGIINVENTGDSDELLNQFGRGNNKGIVYLCHQNDTAYTTSNLDQHKIAYENKLLSKYDVISIEDLTGNSKTMNPYRGFNSLLMRNDADYSVNAQYMSPFVKTFGPGKSFSTRGYGTRITDQSSNKETCGFDDSNDKRKMDSLNIIDYWYPKSTDIFNNPFMFTTPAVLKTETARDATPPNYSITSSEEFSTNNLSNSFNLDNIKLAWRKFNIKNKSNGYYDGHTITYGELENAELSMLNINTNSGEYTEDICHTEFIGISNDNPSQVSLITAEDQSQDTDSSLVKNNNVNAHICNDGIIWSDTNNNYLAIRMSGDEIKYDDVTVSTPDSDTRQPIAGADRLPETHLYISKNGSKSIYQVDFLALLLAAGTYLQKNITPGHEFIISTTLDDLIQNDKKDENSTS